MKPADRMINQYIWDPELVSGKMIFLSGPRQVGKTTYAKNLLETSKAGAYFNWDNPAVRSAYRNDPFFFLKERGNVEEFLVVFDEIHKRTKWKDILKGLYDTIDKSCRLFVTGSARLELFRHSGDSLVGRYIHFHLMPFSLSELARTELSSLWLCGAADWDNPVSIFVGKLQDSVVTASVRDTYETLFQHGGFPEPHLKASQRFLRKWNDDYLSLIVSQDLRDLTRIQQIDTVEKIIRLLPERIGSPLSLGSLSRDVETSFATVKNHIMQLRKLWLLFSLKPFSSSLARSVRREEKCYFVNWTYAGSEAKRFENMIAAMLYRACLIWNDCGWGKAELLFARNFDGVEIDFIIALNGKPALAIEAKMSDIAVARPSLNLSERINVPYVQLVHRPGVFLKHSDRCMVASADRLLQLLP